MPKVKYKVNCKACQLSKRDPKARKRIRYAAYKREEGDETLQDIAIEFNISGPSMYNHVKKHIKDTEPEMGARKEIRVAKAKIQFEAEAQKEMETVLEAQTIEEANPRPAEIIAVDDYIAQGATMVKEGKMKMTPQSFLGAVKLKTDWSSKQQNHQLELIRTIAAFRSGAKKQISKQDKELIDVTGEITGSLDSGENETGRIYRATFGNAPAQGTEEVS